MSQMDKLLLRRNELSYKHIKKGSGIEIGATFLPTALLPEVKVIYLDEKPTSELLETYKELRDKKIVDVGVVDDAENLFKFENDSLDFIIANHFIEHVVNPIKTLKNFLRVLKVNGVIFLAVPDKRATFDRDRPLTTIEHFVDVYKKDYDSHLYEHFEECVRLIEKKPEKDIKKRVDELIRMKFSIHYHTFQRENFILLIDYMRNQRIPIEIVEIVGLEKDTDEFIAILRKTKKRFYFF